jgi:hypothetical protein
VAVAPTAKPAGSGAAQCAPALNEEWLEEPSDTSVEVGAIGAADVLLQEDEDLAAIHAASKEPVQVAKAPKPAAAAAAIAKGNGAGGWR